MDTDHEELYLQKIQEFVYDEDKIVTCNWLSVQLKLTVKECKNLLKTFLQDHKSSKSSNLGVTYVLQGILKENNQICINIVKGDDLEERKALYSSIISETVHSIQKSCEIDLNLISMVDLMNLEPPNSKMIFGGITSNNCILRALKVKERPVEAERAASVDKSKASHLFSNVATKKDVKATQIKESVLKVEKKEEKKENKSDNKVKTPAKGGLTGFLVKGAVNNEPKVKKDENSLNKIENSPIETMEIDDEPEQPKRSDIFDSDTDEEAKKIEEVNKAKKVEEVNKTKKQEDNKKGKKKTTAKRQRKDNSNERPVKKRKRIVERNDSDSDDMFGDSQEEAEEEQVIADSDDEPVFQKASPRILNPKNRKGKYVDKVTNDENGYMVTKKEWVYESASGESEDEKEQKNPQIGNDNDVQTKANVDKKSKSTKEPSPPQKASGKGKKNGKAAPAANQPSIMSFFKKK